MFDCHCHILPGIDDGAQDMETALDMGKLAAAGGTTTIFATPHVLDAASVIAWSVIKEACKQLQAAFEENHIAVNVLPGCEFFMDMELLPLLQGTGAYCLNEGKYLLVELPAAQVPAYAEDFLFSVQAKGITPVLAHIERYGALQQEPERLNEWTKRGVILQVNASSFLGKNGERPQKTAEMLLKQGRVHLFGSDAHSPRTRHPRLDKAAMKLRHFGGAEFTRKLLEENPQQLLSGGEMQLMPVLQQEKQRGWLSRLMGL